MMNGCTFCTKFGRDADTSKLLLPDCVLFESPNFVVVPTLGALTSGWLLIVPRAHYICFGALNNALLQEFYTLKGTVERCLADCYGPLAMFEHGPAQPKQPLGCSVDHAHAHILPLEYDLLPNVKNVFLQELQWSRVKRINDLIPVHRDGRPYLYLEQPLGNGLFATHTNFDSQIFRKAIAQCLGMPERFDWRSYPEQPTVATTVETVERWISKHQSFESNSLSVAA